MDQLFLHMRKMTKMAEALENLVISTKTTKI